MKKFLAVLLITVTSASAQDKALPFADLLKIIPSEIDGFKVTGKPDGMNMTMGEMSYSSAHKEFVKGEQKLIITVSDFKGYASMYQASFGMADGFNYEDSDSKTYSETVGSMKTVITIDKDDNKVNIIAGYKERYLVVIEMRGSKSDDFVKNTLKKINLDDLP